MTEADAIMKFITQGVQAQKAIDDLTARKPCPFCGGTEQQLLPCEVQADKEDGSHQLESWWLVLCHCMAQSGASATEAGAWLHWNRRA